MFASKIVVNQRVAMAAARPQADNVAGAAFA